MKSILNHLVATLMIVLTSFTTPILAQSPSQTLSQSYNDPSIKAKADRIHQAVFTLDTHGDLPYFMSSRPDFDISKAHDPYKTGSRIDLPRMKQGGLDAMFFAVYMGQGDRTPEGYERAKQGALDQFALIHRIVKDYPEMAGLATTPEEGLELKRQDRRAIFIGVENGWTIGKDLSLLQTYYDLGARYMTLSHTRNNDICDSSTDPAGYEHGGLSEFGIEVVREMNRIGLMIDVSHISDDAVYDCLKYSKAPIAATHSSARALFDHPRNLDDNLIRALAEKGGVVQMNMLDGYLKSQSPERQQALAELQRKYPHVSGLNDEQRAQRSKELEQINVSYPADPATLQLVMDHIDHIVQLVGVDHVGIGPDLDGGGGVVGMYDVSEAGNITYELVKRGYSETDIAKIWSGNFFRVMHEVARVADSMRE